MVLDAARGAGIAARGVASRACARPPRGKARAAGQAGARGRAARPSGRQLSPGPRRYASSISPTAGRSARVADRSESSLAPQGGPAEVEAELRGRASSSLASVPRRRPRICHTKAGLPSLRRATPPTAGKRPRSCAALSQQRARSEFVLRCCSRLAGGRPELHTAAAPRRGAGAAAAAPERASGAALRERECCRAHGRAAESLKVQVVLPPPWFAVGGAPTCTEREAWRESRLAAS